MFPKRAQSPMVDVVVSSSEPITLVGGAQFSETDLNISLKFAPVLVGADGGANMILAKGLSPTAVIGDLDSISDAARTAFCDVLHYVPEQDTTDFEKAITRVVGPAIVAVGFTGARLDHTLSVLNAMARNPKIPVLLLNGQDVAWVLPSQGAIELPLGTRVSLMPLSDARATTTGLRWNANDTVFHPAGHTSPSNEVTDQPFTFQTLGPVLAVLPRDHLDVVISAVRGK